MKIVIANNKGGQGKTFFARFVLWLLSQNPDNAGKIAYLDNNIDQLNLADAMRNSDLKRYQSLDEISDDMACVIDTSPSLIDSGEIIQQADILIVPIVLSKDAYKGAMRIREIRGKNDLRIVINNWKETLNAKEVEDKLIADGFNIFGRLPKYERVMYNLDHDLDWFYGCTQEMIDYHIKLITDLLSKPNDK